MFLAPKYAEILEIIATEVPSHSLPYTEHRRPELGAEALDSVYFHVPRQKFRSFLEISGVYQWIGLRENLQETMVFTFLPLNMGFFCKFPLNQSIESRIVLFFRSFLLVTFVKIVKQCSRGPFCESLEKGRFRRDGSGRIPPDLLFVVLADGHNWGRPVNAQPPRLQRMYNDIMELN